MKEKPWNISHDYDVYMERRHLTRRTSHYDIRGFGNDQARVLTRKTRHVLAKYNDISAYHSIPNS